MNDDTNNKTTRPRVLGPALAPTVEPGCIACGACAFNAPEVFEVTDRSRVKPDADIEKNRALIEKAVAQCPVSVIKFKE